MPGIQNEILPKTQMKSKLKKEEFLSLIWACQAFGSLETSGQAGVGISLGGTQLGASPSVGTGRYSRVPGADAVPPADDTLGWVGRHGQAWVPDAAVRAPWTQILWS